MTEIDVHLKQNELIKFLVAGGEKSTYNYKCLLKVYGEAAVHVSTVQPWVNWVNKAETEGAQLHDKLDGMRKGVILVKSAFFVEILRSVISYLQVCPTRMLRIVSPT